MLGLTYLVLVPVDPRYARWLTPHAALPDRYTLVPLVGAAFLVLSGGMSRQRRDCHCVGTPVFIPVETPEKGKGGVRQNDRTLAGGGCRWDAAEALGAV